jgi:hypothetical protein
MELEVNSVKNVCMYVMVKDKSAIFIKGPASANIANSDFTPLELSTSASPPPIFFNINTINRFWLLYSEMFEVK